MRHEKKNLQKRRGVGRRREEGSLERWEVNKSKAARRRRAGGRAGLQVEQSRGCLSAQETKAERLTGNTASGKNNRQL